jgi:hypothetical protein
VSNVNDLQLLLVRARIFIKKRVRARIRFIGADGIPLESINTFSSAIASSEITRHEIVGVVDPRIRV